MPFFDTSEYISVLAGPIWKACMHARGSDSIITAIWAPELLPQKLRNITP